MFTDIEGSAKLLDELGEKDYARLLSEHRRLVRESLDRRSGVEVDTQGDAFFAVFPTAIGAVEAAEEAQEALARGPVHVRMGLHTGTPRVTDEGYVGRDVHKAARIAAAGHGGQVLLSEETRELIDASVIDLGEHRLKDFDEPVPIFQLGNVHFPPLKTISNTNLPRPASSFVGREREVADVVAHLRGSTRHLTLSGSGGSGKTRLAIEAASELVSQFKAGVFWVGLAPLRDPALVVEEIARTLGAKDGLAEHIGEREMLLLLDNLEQVIEAAPELASLVEACPNIKLLVTSRELLRVRGEVEYVVPPLARREAVELFSTRSGLVPDQTIDELCRRLDDLPLPVELAAARTSVLSPAEILERVSERLDLLTGGRDAAARQKTLRATIEWSCDLLSKEEEVLFARLAVFSGGCTRGSAEAVAGAGLDTLQALVEKSLLRHTGDRFVMLETIRDYAAERLEASSEAERLRRQHALHVLALTEHGEPMLHGDAQAEWLARLTAETDNIRAALDWSAKGEPDAALRIAAAASWFWQIKSRFTEGRIAAEATLAAAPAAPLILRARALDGAGRLAYYGGDLEGAKQLLGQAVQAWRGIPDRQGLARSLTYLGIALGHAGDETSARGIGEEAVAVARDTDDWTRAMALWALGANHVLERCEGADPAIARPLLEESAELFRRIGDMWGLGAPDFYLALIARDEGDVATARARLSEAIDCFRSIGDRWRLSHAVIAAGGIAADEGLTEEAKELYGEAVVLLEELGDEDRAQQIAGRIAEIDRARDTAPHTTPPPR